MILIQKQRYLIYDGGGWGLQIAPPHDAWGGVILKITYNFKAFYQELREIIYYLRCMFHKL